MLPVLPVVLVLEDGSSVLLLVVEAPDWLDASMPVEEELDEDCANANPEAVSKAKNNGDKRDIISPLVSKQEASVSQGSCQFF